MADPKLIKLVGTLFRKTLDGSLKWKKTSEDSVFSVSFSSYSVQLSLRSEWNDSTDDIDEHYRLRILDGDGEVVEEIAPYTFESNTFTVPAYEIFKVMFESARRNAMGLNAAVDSILKELDPLTDDIPF